MSSSKEVSEFAKIYKKLKKWMGNISYSLSYKNLLLRA